MRRTRLLPRQPPHFSTFYSGLGSKLGVWGNSGFMAPRARHLFAPKVQQNPRQNGKDQPRHWLARGKAACEAKARDPGQEQPEESRPDAAFAAVAAESGRLAPVTLSVAARRQPCRARRSPEPH